MLALPLPDALFTKEPFTTTFWVLLPTLLPTVEPTLIIALPLPEEELFTAPLTVTF